MPKTLRAVRNVATDRDLYITIPEADHLRRRYLIVYNKPRETYLPLHPDWQHLVNYIQQMRGGKTNS